MNPTPPALAGEQRRLGCLPDIPERPGAALSPLRQHVSAAAP